MIQIKQKSDVTQAVMYAHGLGDFKGYTDLSYFQIIAEYLRELLCTLSSTTNHVSDPVFTTRLLNQARRQLNCILDEELRRSSTDIFFDDNEGDEEEGEDPFRQTLDLLNDIGDIETMGDGYWLPTPVRFITPLNDDSIHALVIGGLSTKELKDNLSQRIELNGLTRTIQRQFIPDNLADDPSSWQAFDDWLGNPPSDLRSWTSDYIERSRGNLSSSGSEVKDFAVYIPNFNNSQLQYFRWHHSSGIHALHDKIFLCRSSHPDRFQGPSFYWLGTIKERDGVVVMDKEYSIPSRDARRLQYGIDLLEGRPTSVTLESGKHKSILFEFKSFLPREEQKFFSSSTEHVTTKFMGLPVRYLVNKGLVDQGVELISRLGIQIKKSLN